ncbi:phage holin, LLH family [Heliophilum fasciatum]|uniref:Superfamily 6 holin (LLH) n=1 Tax=Heliophilum fasciatum TaxID=35700 RepID=A0A4R2RXS2_9FIRM|nr:phage holin, LLH family [Heliophilum fasciatum]MCW2277714.1 DMSO reductase anchor subunit [Heliophilum fasciatum]TCP64791.1 superfamily 6 holin (LLH) [Heliophilum fasciatum]
MTATMIFVIVIIALVAMFIVKKTYDANKKPVVDSIKANTTLEQRQTVFNLGTAAVLLAQNTFGTLTGEERKQKAIAFLAAGASKTNIPLAAEDIETIIDTTYREAKKLGFLVTLDDFKATINELLTENKEEK